MSTTRREFLTTLGALAAVAACRKGANGIDSAAGVTPASSRRKLDRIGIQLYTVRDQMRADMPGTLGRIAGIGYKEVEFAGYFGRTPTQVKELLAQHGLTSPSTHVSIELARQDKTLDDAASIGHRYVTVPSLPRSALATVDAVRRTADEFNAIATRAQSRGLRFAFHNHDAEFRSVDGIVPFDVLVSGTDASLVFFQVDVFWMVKGGGDPRAFIRANPTRVPMLHVKDSAGPPDHKQVDVGAGTIDFSAILREDASRANMIRNVFLEHDSPADPMAFAKTSFDYMSRLEF
jgi:sugar phosphate isomerase/epimerase